MSSKFGGKVALITGAGSGMGRAITVRLAAEGACVLAVDIDRERLDGTKGLASGSVVVHQADLGDADACPAAVAECVERFGRLDVLGNIAGIYLAEHTPKVSREQYRRVMAVNLDAYFFLAQAAIPHLLETGGNIVNIASNAGLQGVPYSAAYCMSKGGVIQLTRSLAVEFLKTPAPGERHRPGRNEHEYSHLGHLPHRHGRGPGYPDGRTARVGRTGGDRRPVRVPGLGRRPLSNRRRIHGGQRANRQLTKGRRPRCPGPARRL